MMTELIHTLFYCISCVLYTIVLKTADKQFTVNLLDINNVLSNFAKHVLYHVILRACIFNIETDF